MLTTEIDATWELCKFAVRSAEKLVHAESDRRTRCVKFEDFVRRGAVNRRCEGKSEPAKSNHRFHWSFLSFACVESFDVSLFNSSVRDSGNLPNKLPSAKAGSLLSVFASCTPAIRASSVSKCPTARGLGSLASR